MSLSSLDLNLLLVLHTVLSERSVARAAERLHVTPSAVSNALARLRVALGDPLVAREGRGIVPTPRALELAPLLARALHELESAVVRGPFDAQRCTRTFTLALADAGQVAWLPRIAAQLAREMPHARLRAVGIDALVSLGDLASSDVDLHVGVRSKAAGVHVEPLFEERTILVGRRDHPALGRRVSRGTLGALGHVAVQMVAGKPSRDLVSAAYARAGIPREVVVTVPTFAAAAAVVARTDLVATLPASFVAAQSASLGLRAVTGKVPDHVVAIAMSWHERTHGDPAMIALRTLVRHAVAA